MQPVKMGQQINNMCELSASGFNIKSWTVQCFSLSLLFVLLHCHCLVYQVVSSSGNLTSMLPKFWKLGVVAFSQAWSELTASILPNGILSY